VGLKLAPLLPQVGDLGQILLFYFIFYYVTQILLDQSIFLMYKARIRVATSKC